MLPRILLSAVVFTSVALLLEGCGKKDEDTKSSPTDKENPTFGIPIAKGGTSTVSGKATLDDEPLMAGRVLLFTADGLLLSAGVIESGRYTLPGAPDGPAEAVVLLDPDGAMPFPTFGTGTPGSPLGGGIPGPPSGGPPGGVRPGGPPSGSGPPGGLPGAPPGGPAGAPSVTGPQPLPAPFLEQLKFAVSTKEQTKYKIAHAKYGKTSTNNPLKVTIVGNTTFNLVLTTK